MPPAQYGQHFWTQTTERSIAEDWPSCIIQRENNYNLLHVTRGIYNKRQGLAHMQFSVLLTELHVIAATVLFQNTEFSIQYTRWCTVYS